VEDDEPITKDRVPRSLSPPIDDDGPSEPSLSGSPTQSLSTQSGSKRPHLTDDETDSDVVEVADVHVSKAPKLEKKGGRPKAGDYDDAGKELVLAGANIYRALLASQGAFPNTSLEMRLIKKAWKHMNAESGLKPRKLTPSIVTIVSFSLLFIILLLLLFVSRLRLVARNFGARLNPKRPLLLRPYMALTADGANVLLRTTGRRLRS
jgi:hypothetical protein